MIIIEEIWKDIFGYEGYYQVSNLGNVKSLDRYINRGHTVQFRKSRLCKKYLTTDGYYQAKLCKDGICKRYSIHRLVLQAFTECRNYSDGWEINHIDTDRTNNRLDNLEWVTHKENIEYSAKLGHMKHYGESNPNYCNNTLKEKYKNNIGLAKKKQSRPGKQNGMCKKVKMVNITDNTEIVFDYLLECSNYIIDNNIFNAKNTQGLANRISKYAKSGDIYKGYKFYLI